MNDEKRIAIGQLHYANLSLAELKRANALKEREVAALEALVERTGPRAEQPVAPKGET